MNKIDHKILLLVCKFNTTFLKFAFSNELETKKILCNELISIDAEISKLNDDLFPVKFTDFIKQNYDQNFVLKTQQTQ